MLSNGLFCALTSSVFFNEYEINFQCYDDHAVRFSRRIFLVDTLNFCFWAPPHSPRFTVKYCGNQYTGYWALCASVNRALDEGIPITDPTFYATVDERTLAHIFRPSNGVTIPMFSQRVSVLREAGTVLQNQFEGSVHNLVASCKGSAQQLIQTITSCFSSYADIAPVRAVFPNGVPSTIPPHINKFCFYKRAQILVADIWACFASSSQYTFHDIATLTMFADYRVPQILVWLSAIKYSDKLLLALRSGDQLQSGSRWEVEIRGCSIHAVELIREHVHILHAQNPDEPFPSNDRISINSILIDFALWDYATQHRDQLNEIPIHRVKSIFY